MKFAASKKTILVKIFLTLAIANFLYTNPVSSVGSDNVNVTAKVNFNVGLKVWPEKRVPLVDHWMSKNIIEIRPVGSTTPLITTVVMSDQYGNSLTNIDSSSLPSGNYDISVKGFSHLRRVYPNYAFFNNTLFFDLTSPLLLAGDTSVVEDNYINSLDVLNISKLIYTPDVRNDLNRDGVVNSLDVSNLYTNLYIKGDD